MKCHELKQSVNHIIVLDAQHPPVEPWEYAYGTLEAVAGRYKAKDKTSLRFFFQRSRLKKAGEKHAGTCLQPDGRS